MSVFLRLGYVLHDILHDTYFQIGKKMVHFYISSDKQGLRTKRTLSQRLIVIFYLNKLLKLAPKKFWNNEYLTGENLYLYNAKCQLR